MSEIKNDLFSPITVGGLTLNNRVALAPMTRARSGKDRIPNTLMADYYAQRSNAGLVITEATTVSAQGNGWQESPGIYTPEMTEGWKPVVNAVHAAGSKVFLQLWHTGRASHSSFLEGELPVAPSPIPIKADGVHTASGKQPHETPRELTTQEIEFIIEDYRIAAQNAKDAGFDGVEVHSANGYLLDTFLQSKTNHRTDVYGGSTEKRFNLLSDVLEAITLVWPSNRVGVRLSPNGNFNDMGSEDYREQFTYAATKLNDFNLAYLHVMDGLGFGFHKLGKAMTLEDFRKVYSGTLIGNCGYTKASATAAIESGKADMIAFGRPYIANPNLVQRFKSGAPLAPEADPSTWYAPTGAEGYTSFPAED